MADYTIHKYGRSMGRSMNDDPLVEGLRFFRYPIAILIGILIGIEIATRL